MITVHRSHAPDNSSSEQRRRVSESIPCFDGTEGREGGTCTRGTAAADEPLSAPFRRRAGARHARVKVYHGGGGGSLYTSYQFLVVTHKKGQLRINVKVVIYVVVGARFDCVCHYIR